MKSRNTFNPRGYSSTTTPKPESTHIESYFRQSEVPSSKPSHRGTPTALFQTDKLFNTKSSILSNTTQGTDLQAGAIKGLNGRKGTLKERKRNVGTGSDMSLTYKMTSGAVGRLVFS